MFSFNCVWTDPLMIHAFLSTASLLSTEQRGRQSTIKILKISQTSMGKDRPCGNPREECHTSVRRRVERWQENGTTQRRQASLCRPQPREGQFLCLCLFKHMCDRGQCRSVMCCNENILWVQVWHFLKSKFETFTSSGVYGLLRYWCLWSFSVWPGALQVLQLPPIIKKLFAIRSLVGVQTWKSRCVYKMQRAAMLEVICPAWAAD